MHKALHETHHSPVPQAGAMVEIGLNAAIVSVKGDVPQFLTIRDGETVRERQEGLPYGTFAPQEHQTLELCLRRVVLEQTGLDVGYVEQLYTFADRGRHARRGDSAPHVMSIGYVALTEAGEPGGLKGGTWRGVYDCFPWEDWRVGKPDLLTREIEPRLLEWAARPSTAATTSRPIAPSDRLKMCFGIGEEKPVWDEEKVLDRYELLYEAGLVKEAERDGRDAALAWSDLPQLGLPLMADHRRILATAITRLRGKIKYRPVVFELMSEAFTLFELQRTVEAILGSHLHKQNFRRLVESGGLVEATGAQRNHTGGRPAKLYRFRREVLIERPSPGVRVKPGRSLG
ncbi:MAG: NAD regulator [Hyphomicrobiaceae bacterium]